MSDVVHDPDADLEIVGQVIVDEIIEEGLDTPERLESAMFNLTEWLSNLELEAGDELVVIRRIKEKEIPDGTLHPTDAG